MRRISVQCSRPGMVVSRDIYDNFGNVLIYQGTRLTMENIDALGRLGGGEMFIKDNRVDDVPVSSMIPGRIQSEIRSELYRFLGLIGETVSAGSSEIVNLSRLEKSMYNMVTQLFPVVMGEVNASGCYVLKDYDIAHPVQTAELSLAIGRKLGYSENELLRLGMGCLLMNIGYAALPEGLLSEPATLTKIERHEVNQHSQYGLQILRDLTDVDEDIIQTVYQHHERFDGSGYPGGMAGEGICMDARIIAIADTYYALVSRRPHRPANRPHEAIEYIMAYSGELFDSKLVNIFTRIIHTYPVGVMIKLNTGESGIVVGSRQGMSSRPTIRLCFDKSQNQLPRPYDIDLSSGAHQHQLITEVIDY